MATILRSSATGKVSEGTTTTVPSSSSSGSRSWYCWAKPRWSASNGTLGAVMVDMAEVNQARDVHAPLDFVELGALTRGLCLLGDGPPSHDAVTSGRNCPHRPEELPTSPGTEDAAEQAVRSAGRLLRPAAAGRRRSGRPALAGILGCGGGMFERLTEQARAVVVAGHQEAAELGHGWIGTEHLVLALARLGDDAGATGPHLLRQLGPDEQAVRDHVLKRLPPTRRRSDHHQLDESPYPAAFRLVLERASQAALRRGAGSVGSEHLLVGLLEESSCAGARLLAELGVTLDRVLRQLGQGGTGAAAARPEPAPAGPFEPTVALTAPAVPVLELARWQAVQDGSGGRVGTQHYLLALLTQQDALAARLLASFGVDYALVKARLMELGEEEPVEPPRPARRPAPGGSRSPTTAASRRWSARWPGCCRRARRSASTATGTSPGS